MLRLRRRRHSAEQGHQEVADANRRLEEASREAAAVSDDKDRSHRTAEISARLAAQNTLAQAIRYTLTPDPPPARHPK